MHRPLVILLVLFGLLALAQIVVSLTVPYDPINSTGPGYFPVMALTVLCLACGVAVIVVGVITGVAFGWRKLNPPRDSK